MTVDIEQLHRRIAALEAENARLSAIAAADNSELERAETALADSEQRYRTLFNSIDEGFCIIEFFDGPPSPRSARHGPHRAPGSGRGGGPARRGRPGATSPAVAGADRRRARS